MLKLLTHPKTIVIAGIVLTIVSALLSHQEVNSNEQDIRSIENNILSNQRTIDNYWQQSQLLQRRQDTAALLLLTDKQSSITEQYFNRTLEMANHPNSTDLTLVQLNDAITSFRSSINERIDTLYLENINLHNEVMSLNAHNSTVKGLALFFQILGMILVLSYNVWDYTRRST